MDLLPHKVCITDLFLLLSLANFQKEMNNYILQRYYKLLDEKDNPPAETKKDDDAKQRRSESTRTICLPRGCCVLKIIDPSLGVVLLRPRL